VRDGPLAVTLSPRKFSIDDVDVLVAVFIINEANVDPVLNPEHRPLFKRPSTGSETKSAMAALSAKTRPPVAVSCWGLLSLGRLRCRRQGRCAVARDH
jgi:hypothetical protein